MHFWAYKPMLVSQPASLLLCELGKAAAGRVYGFSLLMEMLIPVTHPAPCLMPFQW